MNAVATITRLLSSLACLIVIASFAMWAANAGDRASQEQIAEISATGEAPFVPPVQTEEDQREIRNEGPREVINDISDQLVKPFNGVAESSTNEWVQHGVPALLAILAYGMLLRLLVNYMPVERR